ncbi:DUF1156 domain-containing protein [Mycobacterium noviomagense]|uniref:DUF1156 domain-containing protein n=2 Tax=Mycobacteriaceae TaxID=1762 RepID=A0A7I7PEP5_9MYCO|nr:DUF1156 domain-containing protein [Mycobacterium noviomagense]ORB12684.1 hypothetical protein BST37_15685 [Mycobacterium noviomagense]BBY07104.1 hypothetical protein MNVI_24220 [Mycobacterium noviomagense]
MTELYKRKLIEVALPLEAINRESAREKSIRHGHPSTLHLWWARRPLAAARAVLFAQLVDDPSAHPEEFPTEGLQRKERERLHSLIERLVVWENTRDEKLLAEAHAEIVKSCDGNPPPILDPFAGGGTIPLEAQRLGLKAHASDLNPVAVLINKALIEIPPKFRDQPPVFPGLAESEIRSWKGAEGLAADVRAYGQWVRDEAERQVGHLYPQAILPDGSKAPVVAWIWARTVRCPNPPCGIRMPLVRSWWLAKKKGKEAYVVPTVAAGAVRYSVENDPKAAPTADQDGTVGRTGARCISCGAAVPLKYIKAEGRLGRLGSDLMALVAQGPHQRIYLPPSPEDEACANVAVPSEVPEGEVFDWPGCINVYRYGMTKFSDLFTPRQLTVLCTLSDVVVEAREVVLRDAIAAGLPMGDRIEIGGTGAAAYADAVMTYLGMAVSKCTNVTSSITSWMSDRGAFREVFAQQGISLRWDYAESNPLGTSGGSWLTVIDKAAKVISTLTAGPVPQVIQANAVSAFKGGPLLSTDPPYYINIGYADVSDFFYVWLRRVLRATWPKLLATMQVPKTDELVANPFRHGGKDAARNFFEEGFKRVFQVARHHALTDFPIAVFYAVKQAEASGEGMESAGWETILESMIHSGWMITATWPMRTEGSGRLMAKDQNALASSIVLALRPRPSGAPVIDRREFIAAVQEELPGRLRELQLGAVAPVDLPQAAIGPGMAVFSRYTSVLEADGSRMTIRSALARINEILDHVLNEQEGDFVSTTRFAIAWYRQHGYGIGKFGDADNLARARNTSVDGMARDGILTSRGGKVQLIKPADLSWDYDVVADSRVSNWEVLHHVIKVLERDGIAAAGDFLGTALRRADSIVDADLVKELAHLLFRIAEGNGWTKDALSFNNLVTSWPEILDITRSDVNEHLNTQSSFDFNEEDD